MDKQIDYSQMPTFLLVVALLIVTVSIIRYFNKKKPQIMEFWNGGPARTWKDEDNRDVTYNARTRTLTYHN